MKRIGQTSLIGVRPYFLSFACKEDEGGRARDLFWERTGRGKVNNRGGKRVEGGVFKRMWLLTYLPHLCSIIGNRFGEGDLTAFGDEAAWEGWLFWGSRRVDR